MAPGGTALQTLLVGVDGATQRIVDSLPTDRVPRLQALLDRRASGRLESQLPPWTPSAWPSLYSGVNPGKHGIFGFLRFEGYDWSVVDYTDLKAHTLWELLDRHGIKSVVVNAPVTHPPAAFDGALVPGYVAPTDPECHPPGILADIRAELGDYRVYNDSASDDPTRAERVAGYEDLVEMRGAAFRYLVERFEPDFGFLQFQQTDTVIHELPGDDAALERVYAAVDDELDAVLDACEPDVVVVASDHGVGPYDGYEFRPNTFLRDRGEVVTTVGDGGMPTWSTLGRDELGEESSAREGDPSVLERSLELAARAGVTSQRLGRVLQRLRLDGLALRLVPDDLVRAGTEHVDFAASRAYVRNRIELGVRLNLEGREPAGTVSREDYEAVREELIEALADVRTPDGEPVFEAVRPREDVFSGPHVADAPDVVLVPAAFDHYISSSVRETAFGPPSEPWNHKRHGLVAAVGDVDESADLSGAHLLDVAPTILATFGLPAAERMDGEVLPVVEPAGTREYPPYRDDGHRPGETRKSGETVERRLAELGYLER